MEKGRKQGENTTVVELTDEDRRKFKELVMPQLDNIKRLVAYYSTNPTYFNDNYSCVLEDLARHIHSFDESRMESLKSWTHVAVKNCVLKCNELNTRSKSFISDVPYENYTSSYTLADSICAEKSGLFDNISDDVYNALMKVPIFKLRPLLNSIKGYTINEIIQLEMDAGSKVESTAYAIKCRIFSAKQIIYKELYGHKRPTIVKSRKGVSKGGEGAGQ